MLRQLESGRVLPSCRVWSCKASGNTHPLARLHRSANQGLSSVSVFSSRTRQSSNADDFLDFLCCGYGRRRRLRCGGGETFGGVSRPDPSLRCLRGGVVGGRKGVVGVRKSLCRIALAAFPRV